MYLTEKTIKNLDERLKELNSLRPISVVALKKIKEQFEIEMTYNTNAIEGNSLTLKETFWVINEGLTIKEKPLKDHLEAKNQKEALDFLYEFIEKDKNNTVSEKLIREIQSLVVMDTQREYAGKYRDGNVIISGSDHTPPESFEVPRLMGGLVRYIGGDLKKTHLIESAAIFHHKIVSIHPFWDGNGRTARILMNLVVMRGGYPMTVILKNDRKRYYRVLAEADKDNFAPLCEFIAQAVLRSLNIYLKMLKPSKDTNLNFVSLNELSKVSTYSATYLRKLATQGKLEAFKEGRNWLSSKRALDDYINSLK